MFYLRYSYTETKSLVSNCIIDLRYINNMNFTKII